MLFQQDPVKCVGRAGAGMEARNRLEWWGGHCTTPEQAVWGNQGADAGGDSASVLRTSLDLVYERGGWSIM